MRKLTFRNAVRYDRRWSPVSLYVARESLHRCAIGKPVSSLTSGNALKSLVVGKAFESSVCRWFQFPIHARRSLDRYLEVTVGSVSTGVGCQYGDVFKSANRNHSSLWYESYFYWPRGIGGVDSTTSLVEVHGVAVLLVYELYYVALWATQFWWSDI